MMIRSIKYYFLFLLLVKTTASCAQSTITPIPNSWGLWTVDMSADDRFIALGGDDSLLKIFSPDLKLLKWIKQPDMIRNVKWHPQQNLLGISTRKTISIMDVDSGKEIQLEGKPNGSRAIGWNYNGELFAAAAGRGVIWIWNKEGKLLRQIQKTSADGIPDTKDFITMDWHPSKNILLAGGDEIRIYDTSGQQLNIFPHREINTLLLSMKWHPSGDFFVTGDYGHEDEGKPTLLRFWKTDGTMIREIKDSHGEMRNISWSKNGERLATASEALRIRDKEGKILYTGNNNGIILWGVDWNGDSDKLVTVSWGNEAKGSIRLWSKDGKLLQSIQ